MPYVASLWAYDPYYVLQVEAEERKQREERTLPDLRPDFDSRTRDLFVKNEDLFRRDQFDERW